MSPSEAKPKVEIDDLLTAVETVELLKNAVADQGKAIAAILDNIIAIDLRLTAVEGALKGQA